MNRTRLIAATLAALLAGALLAPRLFDGPLRHWDEAWYAQVSREMRESQSWLTPRWNGQPWFHKPPLTFWATMAAQTAFGDSEISARLFAFLCGVGVAACSATFVVGGGRAPAFVAVGSLLAIPEFARYSARGQIDSPLTLFIAVQLMSFWKGRTDPRWHWLGGIAFGLALMTKGAAAGLSLVVIAAYGAATRDLCFLRRQSFLGGLALGAAIAAPWHFYELMTHGERFLADYGSRHLAQFFTNIYPETDGRAPPADYYLQFLVRSGWGWGLLLLAVAGVVAAARTKDRLLIFAVCWSVAIPISLSFARTKWNWYLVPAYPGFALVAARLAILYGTRFQWRIAGFAMAAALVVACEPLIGSGAKEGESEIRGIAAALNAKSQPPELVVAAQFGRVRQSVYPIAAVYYLGREVHTVHSLDALAGLASLAERPFVLMIRESMIGAVEGIRIRPGQRRFTTTRLEQCGDVVAIRLSPVGPPVGSADLAALHQPAVRVAEHGPRQGVR